MLKTTAKNGRRVLAAAPALAALMTMASVAPAHAERELFFEQTTRAFWGVPHTCDDGSVVEATFLVETTRDYEAPATEDDAPTARLQYQAVCNGRSFTWGSLIHLTTLDSTNDLKSVTASGSGIARDNLGGTHTVSIDVAWTGSGPMTTTVNNPGSMRRQREATATGVVTFHGDVLVDGPANHSFRPAPFIRVDTEK